MNYTDVFTEKEAESLLRKAMLEYDFGHFSFKPRLLFKNYSQAMATCSLDFETEMALLEVYSDNVTTVTPLPAFNKSLGNLFLPSESGFNTVFALLLNHRTNYYMDLKSLSFEANLGIKTPVQACTLKTTKLYLAIVTLMLAITHYDSVVPHLKWLVSGDADEAYNDVVNQNKLSTEISLGKPITSSMFTGYDITSTPVALTKTISDSKSISAHNVGVSAPVFAQTIKQVFKEYLIFGSEIINRIETIKDEDIRKILYSMFTTSQNSISELLYVEDAYGNTVPSSEIKDIVFEKDMETRYNLIKEFVKRNDSALDKAVDEYINHDKTVSSTFGIFIKFCQNESILNIRKKTIIILYNELKSRKLLDKLRCSSSYDSIPLPGIAGGISSDGSDEDAANDETTSMMKDSYTDYGDFNVENDSEKEYKRKHSESGVAFEELDKLTANFEADMYKFEVSTKTDNSDDARSKYLDIANDMALLNSSLIRSIKEIKVYNTGGKNPGKRTGKLDRKNLYKYKTTKDIFFDNTYKVKESDLAFGIILDVSGSMSGNGIRYGKATMIVLHETLKALNINHSIITHTSKRRHNCVIDKYQSFKEDKNFSCNKNYALANIKAHSGNCDSASLYYMEQCMKRVKNKDKICIIFSDGEPTECSDTELIEQVKHMERNGIRVIGVGINYPKIKEYYRNNANGSNLKEMFNIVSDILKQYVLEKVDKE